MRLVAGLTATPCGSRPTASPRDASPDDSTTTAQLTATAATSMSRRGGLGWLEAIGAVAGDLKNMILTSTPAPAPRLLASSSDCTSTSRQRQRYICDGMACSHAAWQRGIA